MRYRVLLTPTAEAMFKAVTDLRVREGLYRRAAQLSEEPDKQGKPLEGELSGYCTIRAVGQRYRIVYQVDSKKQRVVIMAAGLRKEGSKTDVYRLARRLVRLGLLQPE